MPPLYPLSQLNNVEIIQKIPSPACLASHPLDSVRHFAYLLPVWLQPGYTLLTLTKTLEFPHHLDRHYRHRQLILINCNPTLHPPHFSCRFNTPTFNRLFVISSPLHTRYLDGSLCYVNFIVNAQSLPPPPAILANRLCIDVDKLPQPLFIDTCIDNDIDTCFDYDNTDSNPYHCSSSQQSQFLLKVSTHHLISKTPSHRYSKKTPQLLKSRKSIVYETMGSE